MSDIDQIIKIMETITISNSDLKEQSKIKNEPIIKSTKIEFSSANTSYSSTKSNEFKINKGCRNYKELRLIKRAMYNNLKNKPKIIIIPKKSIIKRSNTCKRFKSLTDDDINSEFSSTFNSMIIDEQVYLNGYHSA